MGANESPTGFAILVEDKRTEQLVRRVLKHFGYGNHHFRIPPYPVGKGSAKQWVNQEYPKELCRLRSKSFQNMAIFVVTDADQLTVQNRVRELEKSVTSSGVANRSRNEHVVFWIPKWSIETWLLYFHEHQLQDETKKLKYEFSSCDWVSVAKTLVDEYRRHKSGQTLMTQPSLETAYHELRRFGL